MLGEELRRRGQEARAREYFEKAKIIVRFFLSGFQSEELKKKYLAVESRARVFQY